MLAIDRWRRWRPSDEKSDESPECEPSKPPEPTFEGFDGSIPGEPQIVSAPADDPEAWRQPFALWLQSACVRHWRVSGGVGALHRAYCDWEITRDGVPCKRETFETLLRERGFTLRAFPGVLLADGLALWPDAERLREAGLLQ